MKIRILLTIFLAACMCAKAQEETEVTSALVCSKFCQLENTVMHLAVMNNGNSVIQIDPAAYTMNIAMIDKNFKCSDPSFSINYVSDEEKKSIEPGRFLNIPIDIPLKYADDGWLLVEVRLSNPDIKAVALIEVVMENQCRYLKPLSPNELLVSDSKKCDVLVTQ